MIGCPEVPPLENGNTTLLNGDGTNVGSAFAFMCDSGYQLKGSQRILCTQFGWSYDLPECEGEWRFSIFRYRCTGIHVLT